MINHCSSALVCTKLSNKMKSITKIVLYFSFVILAPWLADAATDYCRKGLCPYGYTHIACNNNKHFDKICPSDAKLVEMPTTLQNLIVDKFNEKRNFVAGGNVALLEPACRMGTMKWDKELAQMAELYVKKCKFIYDCHNTESYQHSGQNVEMFSYLKCNRATDTEKFIEVIGDWYDEVQYIQASIIKKYRKSSAGQFATMVLERNIAVGCAASTFSTKGEDSISYLMACNFAYMNFNDRAVYKTCPTPGEECETGKNPKYPNLCSTSEKYDVNESP